MLQRLAKQSKIIFLGNGRYMRPTQKGQTPMTLDTNTLERPVATKRNEAFPQLETLPAAKKGPKVKTYELSREQWFDNDRYPYFPTERDFVAHGRKLMDQPDFRPDHPMLGQNCALVTVAETGRTYKLNAMTTTYLAKAGKVNFPATLHVKHFYTQTLAEAQPLYKGYDWSPASKGAKDKLVSALKYVDISCESNTLHNGGGTTGVSIAFHALHGERSNTAYTNVEEVVDALKKSIRAVDGVLVYAETHRTISVMKSSPAIATMILSYRQIITRRQSQGIDKSADIREWRKFWESVIDARGVGDTSDPHVRMWIVLSEDIKGGGGGREVTYEATERALYIWTKRFDTLGRSKLSIPLQTFLPVLRKKAS